MKERIRIPTFDAEVVFIFDTDKGTVERFLSRIAKLKTERLRDEYAGITIDLGNMTWVVYIPDTGSMDDIQMVRTVSHETTHVVLQLLDKVGVQDDETFCYCQDSLLGMLLEKIAKNRMKKEEERKRKRLEKREKTEQKRGKTKQKRKKAE